MVFKRKKAEPKEEAKEPEAPSRYTNKNKDGTPATIGESYQEPVVLPVAQWRGSNPACPTCGTAFAGPVCAVDGTRAQ